MHRGWSAAGGVVLGGTVIGALLGGYVHEVSSDIRQPAPAPETTVVTEFTTVTTVVTTIRRVPAPVAVHTSTTSAPRPAPSTTSAPAPTRRRPAHHVPVAPHTDTLPTLTDSARPSPGRPPSCLHHFPLPRCASLAGSHSGGYLR